MKKLINEVERLQQLAGNSKKDIDDDVSIDVKDFAAGVAKILKDRYGEHNYKRFMEALIAQLRDNG